MVPNAPTSDVQGQDLQSDRIDVGIALAPIEEPGLTFHPLFEDHLILTLPDGSPEARRRALQSLGDFRQHPFVSIQRGLAPGLYDATQHFCVRAGFTPRIPQHARQMQTTISIVSTGLGIALIPAVLTKLQREGVVYRPLKERSPKITPGTIYRTNECNPALKNFLELAGQTTKGIGERRGGDDACAVDPEMTMRELPCPSCC